MEKIGEWLYNNLPPESLVLASVDFSHHQDLKATLKHDLNSEQILKNLDLKNLQNIEADSPQSLAVLFAFLRLHGASKIEFINTNSAYMSGNLDSRDITSYFFATFTK